MNRTSQQNRALHKYFRELADILNQGGHDQRAVFAMMKEGVEIPWWDEAIKHDLWKPIQKAMTGKESTTELETDEVSKIYDVLNRWLSDKFNGLHVPFPSEGEISEKQRGT